MTTPGLLPSNHQGNRSQRGNPPEVIDLTREEITFTNLFAELRTHIRNSPEHTQYPLISILAYLIYQGKHPSARPIHYLNTLLYILQRQSLLGDYPTRLQKLRQLFAAILYIRNLQEATVKATIAEQTATLHINALNVPEPDELPSDSEPEQ